MFINHRKLWHDKSVWITCFVQEVIGSYNYFFCANSRNTTVISKLHLKYLITVSKTFLSPDLYVSVHQSSHICLTISAHWMLSQANKQHRSYPNERDSLHYGRSPCNPSIIWSICYKLSNLQDCSFKCFFKSLLSSFLQMS